MILDEKQQNSINQKEQYQNTQTIKTQPQNEILSQIKVGNFIFSTQNVIGKGSFSKVYRGHDQQNPNHQVAIKVIQKKCLNNDLKILVQAQIRILRLVNHPNIVKCYQIKDDQNNIYVIMQLCNGGDLESRVDKNGPLLEQEAAPIIKGVFKGLLYLSENNIIHRDIKVANIFLHKGNAKIADFGFAIHSKSKYFLFFIKRKQFQDISIGSPIYMSPQGIKHNVYGPTTDVWSFGVFMYQLLHGCTPYSHCTKQKQLKYNISNQIGWNNLKPGLSYSIKQVIYKCLEINYEKRITFERLKQLDFFQQYDQKISLVNNNKQQNKSVNKINKLDKRLKNVVYENKQHSLLLLASINKSLQNKSKLHSARDYNMKNKHTIIGSPLRVRDKLVSNGNITKTSQQKTIMLNKQRLYSENNQQDYESSYKNFMACIKEQTVSFYDNNSPQLKSHNFEYKSKHYPTKLQMINNTYSKNINNTNNNISNNTNNNISNNTNNNISNKNNKLVLIDFPLSNINCYLYIVHFARLLYKLTRAMISPTQLHDIKHTLQLLCIFILKQTITMIQHYIQLHSSSRSQKYHKDSVTIQQTLIKYFNQYSAQFNHYQYQHKYYNHYHNNHHNNHKQKTIQHLLTTNNKLEQQTNNILSKTLKTNNNINNIQIPKLLYLTYIYHKHFYNIFVKYFIRIQYHQQQFKHHIRSKCNIQEAVKLLANDIELTNTIQTIESYLKSKRKQQQQLITQNN